MGEEGEKTGTVCARRRGRVLGMHKAYGLGEGGIIKEKDMVDGKAVFISNSEHRRVCLGLRDDPLGLGEPNDMVQLVALAMRIGAHINATSADDGEEESCVEDLNEGKEVR